MSRLSKLLRSPATRPARKSRLGVQALENREVPATFTVTTPNDVVNPFDGVLSLREAITRANTNPGADIIKLPAGTLNVTRTGADNTNAGGDLDVTGSLTIVGAGDTTTVIDAKNQERLFDVLGNINIKFADLALLHGGNAASFGGAVQALSANIVFDNVQAVSNKAAKGGAINAETGNVTVLNSHLIINSATGAGGAIHVGTGKLFLDKTIVSGNDAGTGGGIATDRGLVTVARSDVKLNTAGAGGGIASQGGTVNLSNTFVQNNESRGDGGGLFVLGTVNAEGSRILNNRSVTSGGGVAAVVTNLTRSTVSGNRTGGFGGGISTGSATIKQTTVSGNTAGTDGGGLLAVSIAALDASTVNGNTAGQDGGGIKAGTLNMTNATVSGNLARRNSGGIRIAQTGNFLNSTIAFNHADVFGGGVESLGSAVRVKNTIIANNSANQFGQDVLGLFDSLGHNLVRDPNSGNANTDFTDPLNRDILGVDPKLGALANNGGPTQTHALLAGSRAIDHGANSGAPLTDQRGVARPRDGDHNGIAIADIGAFEL